MIYRIYDFEHKTTIAGFDTLEDMAHWLNQNNIEDFNNVLLQRFNEKFMRYDSI